MARFTEKFFLVAGSFSSQFEAIVRALKAEDGDVIWLAPMGSTAFPGVQTIKVNMNSIKSLQTAMARVRKRSVHLHGAVNLIDLPEATGFLLTGGSTFGPSLSTVLDPLAKLIHAEVGKMLESGGGSIVSRRYCWRIVRSEQRARRDPPSGRRGHDEEHGNRIRSKPRASQRGGTGGEA